jgi:integrase
MEDARLTISRSLTVTANGVHVGPTKTHAVRVVALDPVAVEALNRRWAEQQRFAEEVGVQLDPDPFVLSYSYSPRADTHAGPDYVSHQFRKLCKKVGVMCRFHDLRHFAATQLVAAGTDVRTVAARLGHADASTTLRIYSHALPERDREAAGVLGRLVAPALDVSADRRSGTGSVELH